MQAKQPGWLQLPLALVSRMRTNLTVGDQRFRSAFDHAHVGMAIVAHDGRCVEVNPALGKMLGYSEPELLNARIQDLAEPDDAVRVCRLVDAMIESGEVSLETEIRYVHKQGHLVWALVSIAAMRESADGPTYLINQLQDITDRKRYEERLRFQADHDPLTGLMNRRRFREVMRPQVADGRGVVLFLDLDGFKQINDDLGHEAGDELLRDLAAGLRQALQAGEVIGRLGGDEFALLLPGATCDRSLEVIERVQETLRQHVVVVGGRPMMVTASIGMAIYPDHGTTPEELLARADMAMYQVKETGRNGLITYTPSLARHGLKHERSHWEPRIRQALEIGGFELHAQPVLHLATGQVAWYELLLRLRGERGELISPGAFLGIAERLGLIHAIDQWVVGAAIQALRAAPDLRVSVNLSGRSLSSLEPRDAAEQRMAQAGIDPSRLMFEITETAAVLDREGAGQFLERLRRLGCTFALDDFGAGFSSFHQLKHLPIDFIKIDGNLVRQLPHFPADRHIVRAIAQMAEGLKMPAVAEFVEDEPTVQILRECGVAYAQGYHLGRPVPLSQIVSGSWEVRS